MLCGLIKAQKNNNFGGASVKLYLIEWDLKTKFPYTAEYFMKYYRYTFEANIIYNDSLFFDNESCKKTLMTQPKLKDSINTEKKHVVCFATIKYSKKEKFNLFFDREGNYQYDGVWYSKNLDLYRFLFSYFSNIIVKDPIQMKNDE